MQTSNRLPRPLRIAIIVLAALLVALAALWGVRVLLHRLSARSGTPTIARLPDVHASMDIRPFGPDIVVRDAETLRCIAADGTARWAIPMTPGARFDADNRHVVIWEDKQFTVYDENGNQLYAPQQMPERIELARCGLRLTAVVVGDDDQEIRIFSEEAKEIDARPLVRIAPMDIRFFGPDDLLWYSTLDTGSSKPLSAVQVIQPDRRKSLGNRTSNDEILYRMVCNPQRNEFVAIGTHTASFFDQTMVTDTGQQRVYGWHLADAKPLKIATCLVFTPFRQDTVEAPITDIRVSLGADISDIRLPTECMRVLCGERAVYAVSTNAIYAYDYPPAGKPMAKEPRVVSMQGVQLTGVNAILDGDRLVVSVGDQVAVVGMGK